VDELSVSEVKYDGASGQIRRIFVIRLRTGVDMIEGLEKALDDYGVKNAAVLLIIGSLRRAHFMYVVDRPDLKLKAGYSEPITIEHPVELLGARGVSCISEGKRVSHIHGSICDQDGRIYGGHFIKGGNPALYTLEIVVAELSGIEMSYEYDEEIDFVALLPRTSS